MRKLLFALGLSQVVILLLGVFNCATPTAPPAQTCAMFKITAGETRPINGEYKSQFQTRKIGSIAYMYAQLKGDSLRAWTVTDHGLNATPRTEIEDFTAYRIDGPYLFAGSFIGEVRRMDSAAFTIAWKDGVYEMAWRRELVGTSIFVEPRPPGGPSGCLE